MNLGDVGTEEGVIWELILEKYVSDFMLMNLGILDQRNNCQLLKEESVP